MSTGAIVAIIVVVIVVAAVLVVVTTGNRRRRLRERFGPEYDRAVTEHGSKRGAEAELAERERHVRELDIRPLSAAKQSQYRSEWTAVQEQFVDAPQAAVTGAQTWSRRSWRTAAIHPALRPDPRRPVRRAREHAGPLPRRS